MSVATIIGTTEARLRASVADGAMNGSPGRMFAAGRPSRSLDLFHRGLGRAGRRR